MLSFIADLIIDLLPWPGEKWLHRHPKILMALVLVILAICVVALIFDD